MSDLEIKAWIYLAVVGGLLVASLILHGIIRIAAPVDAGAKRYGLAALFMGADERTSTSKLQALVWTYAVLWALISILAAGGPDEFREIVGAELREEYFLLLGGPYLVAIVAKAKTVYDVNRAIEEGEADPKPAKAPSAPGGVGARVAEIVTNDENSVDLGDFQYFAFTLLTVTYFAWAFIASPSDGLPAIPGTLLVLMGISQATYLGKKTLIPPERERARGARGVS